MDKEYKQLLNELASEFDKFSQQMSEKLNAVISDTELSTMKGLMATKEINHAMHAMKKNTASINTESINEVSVMLLDMQENFQFHDIVRQTIERLLEAFDKRENIILKLTGSLNSINELQKVLVEMKSINQEYLEVENQHVSSISIQDDKPLFQAF